MTRAQIVLATHNPRMDLLERQVASVVAQSVTDWRCLVLDDSSSAGARRDIAAVLGGDTRFCMLSPQPHLGPYRAFEHLLREADQDLPVFLCDQDDSWAPEKMRLMLAELENAPAVFSAMRVVDEFGTTRRARFLPRKPSPSNLQPAQLLLMNSVSGASLAVSAETRRKSLPFPAPQSRGWHDQWLAAVAARIGSITYLDEPLTDYTQHAGQVTGDGLRSVDLRRLRGFARRIRTVSGLRADLRSRTDWITAAANRLLSLSDQPDSGLESLGRGRWSAGLAQQLWTGVHKRDVPLTRAALLAAGFATSDPIA